MPSAVAQSTFAAAAAARSSVTANRIVAPGASSASASATDSPAGPATEAESACDSGRPSSAQIAPSAPQPVVSGRSIRTASCESGSTVIFHRSRRPPTRLARVTSPPVTANDASRSVL